MDSKQLFKFLKDQLPMLPHIHAALDEIQLELDACRQAPKPQPVEAPSEAVSAKE
jgi:hypothetical protein